MIRVCRKEMLLMMKKADDILEGGKKIKGIGSEDKYTFTLGKLVFNYLYGKAGNKIYYSLFDTYKEIHLGINGHWKDIISEVTECGLVTIRDKGGVDNYIKLLEYKIYDEVYKSHIVRNTYLLEEEGECLPIDEVVDIDKYAQEELNKKLSISNLRAQYVEAMAKWKSACKDLKLGGYKCEVDDHPAYTKWQGMLNRAYGATSSKWYDNVTVSEAFKHYSNFKSWYLTQYLEDGWELDKDLLVKGNKVYCASRCCFLPKEINSALAINRALLPSLAQKYRSLLSKGIFEALLQY